MKYNQIIFRSSNKHILKSSKFLFLEKRATLRFIAGSKLHYGLKITPEVLPYVFYRVEKIKKCIILIINNARVCKEEICIKSLPQLTTFSITLNLQHWHCNEAYAIVIPQAIGSHFLLYCILFYLCIIFNSVYCTQAKKGVYYSRHNKLTNALVYIPKRTVMSRLFGAIKKVGAGVGGKNGTPHTRGMAYSHGYFNSKAETEAKKDPELHQAMAAVKKAVTSKNGTEHPLVICTSPDSPYAEVIGNLTHNPEADGLQTKPVPGRSGSYFVKLADIRSPYNYPPGFFRIVDKFAPDGSKAEAQMKDFLKKKPEDDPHEIGKKDSSLSSYAAPKSDVELPRAIPAEPLAPITPLIPLPPSTPLTPHPVPNLSVPADSAGLNISTISSGTPVPLLKAPVAPLLLSAPSVQKPLALLKPPVNVPSSDLSGQAQNKIEEL